MDILEKDMHVAENQMLELDIELAQQYFKLFFTQSIPLLLITSYDTT